MIERGSKFDVLYPAEYLERFTQMAAGAEQRLIVQGLYMWPGRVTQILEPVLINAAQREVDTRVYLDSYTHLAVGQTSPLISLFSSSSRGKRAQARSQTDELYERLQSKGVSVAFLNPPNVAKKLIPQLSTTHIKGAVIDGESFLGGLNYSDDSFEALDFMLGINDPEISEQITQELGKSRDPKAKDISYESSQGNFLYIDAGAPGRSMVRDVGVDLIENAKKSVKLTGAFVPDGVFLEALYKAHRRGVFVETALAPFEKGNKKSLFWLLNKIGVIQMQARGLTIPLSFAEEWVNARLLIVDEEIVLTGSSNFNTKGVKAGTKEMNLLTSEPNIVRWMVSFFDQLRSKSHVA